MSMSRVMPFLIGMLVLGSNAHAAGRCGDISQRPWCDTALSAAQRASLLVDAMTLSQKFELMAGDDIFGAATGEPAVGTVDGIEELGIPPIYMSDGPMGPRERLGTLMPSPLALGASFDPVLAREVAATIATEVRLKGNDLVHAPTVDVMRIAQAGRTFETFGEDPYLASRIAVPWVQGVQAEGVIANVKHFVLNTQEGLIGVPPITAVLGGRQLVNAIVDERTLREIYLPPFRAAVTQADAASIMCAYNLVNGRPACSSPSLLGDILRGEWGFDGFVLTDYVLANKETAGAVNAGLDIEMPIPQLYAPALLHAAVLSGLVTEATIDLRVHTILRTLFRFGFFDRAAFPSDDSLIDIEAHARVARKLAERGTVLLSNNGVLPVDESAVNSIAVIGVPATENYDVGGSASVQAFRYSAPLDAIRERAGRDVRVEYLDGQDQQAAAELARNSDIAIVFVRDAASEGVDKTCLSLDCPPLLPGLPVAGKPQDELIAAVASVNPNTIVLIQSGGPILTPWRDQAAAVLSAWYPGQEAGAALAGILFGDVDPGGRLPVTFMADEQQTPTAGQPLRYPGVLNQAVYSEGVFIGYRWYDEFEHTPAFAFGHGLSYARFAFSALQLEDQGDAIEIGFTVRNTSARAGFAVPQIYLGMPDISDSVTQPPWQLKGFDRVALDAGEEQRVAIRIESHDLQYWDSPTQAWRTAPGCYRLALGHSSRDLVAEAQFSRGPNDACVQAEQHTARATPAGRGGSVSLGYVILLLCAALARFGCRTHASSAYSPRPPG